MKHWYLSILVALSLAACASTARLDELKALCDPTTPDVEECYEKAETTVKEEQEYTRLDRKTKRKERLIAFIIGCKEIGGRIMYTCRSCSATEIYKMRKADRKGQIYIPRGAQQIDFQCW
jgi:hypothetical protein